MIENKREFICMIETYTDTQKKIRQWESTGYEVYIVSQNTEVFDNKIVIITSLWRAKI